MTTQQIHCPQKTCICCVDILHQDTGDIIICQSLAQRKKSLKWLKKTYIIGQASSKSKKEETRASVDKTKNRKEKEGDDEKQWKTKKTDRKRQARGEREAGSRCCYGWGGWAEDEQWLWQSEGRGEECEGLIDGDSISNEVGQCHSRAQLALRTTFLLCPVPCITDRVEHFSPLKCLKLRHASALIINHLPSSPFIYYLLCAW